MKKTLLSLSIFALAACGGGGNDNGNTNIFNSGGSIVGLWDASENMGADGIDELYYDFDKSGLVTVYDYAGDSFDQEGNCYWIYGAEIKSLGKNEYKITPLGEGTEESFVWTITRSGDKLTITDNDPEDPYTLTLPKSNKSISNFTPECVDDDSARARNKASNGVKLPGRP